MNARLYDPSLGRFLSPDPILQDISNLQSFNRYSYCLNNPLSLTDPSGYSWLSQNWKSLVGVAIGIAATVMSAGILAPGAAALTAWGAAASGAVGGFVGSVSGTMLAGGNLSQVIKSGVVGAVIGAAACFAPFGTQWLGETACGALEGTAGALGMTWTSGSNDYGSFWKGTLLGGLGGFVASENFRNLIKGGGFYSNQTVYNHIMNSNLPCPQQAAIDYFGFNGSYDPMGATSDAVQSKDYWGKYNVSTGKISYGRLAFDKDEMGEYNFGTLKGVYIKESTSYVNGINEQLHHLSNQQLKGFDAEYANEIRKYPEEIEGYI